MRVIVMGGTRFIGRALVSTLVAYGHDVLVVHRGQHEPPGRPTSRHLHVDRHRLGERRDGVAAFGAEAVVDFSALTGPDTDAVLGVLRTLRPAPHLVVVSSMDAYRAWASLWSGETTDAVPLSGDAALRTTPAPERQGPAPPGWDVDVRAYDKLDVERAYLAHGPTVCRLPLASFRLWAQQIVRAVDAELELVEVPAAALPPDLALTGNMTQHLLADPSRAARRLGWVHAPAEAFVGRSARWHLANPPEPEPEPGSDDFTLDDRALDGD